jgi:hypothetical protein
MSALYQTFFIPVLGYYEWIKVDQPFSFWFIAKHYFFMMLGIPAMVRSLYFFWTLKHEDNFNTLCLMPLSLIPVIFANITTLRVLSLVGIFGGCIQLYVSHRIKMHGLQVI